MTVFFFQSEARERALKQIRDSCMDSPDVLAGFPAFKRFDRNGLKADIKALKIDELTEDQVDFVFFLLKQNMESLYELVHEI